MKIEKLLLNRNLLESIESERKFTLSLMERDNADEIDEIVRKILCHLKPGPPILAVINSDGGSIMEGLKVHDCFKISPSPVIGLVIGRATSAALIALQGCSYKLAVPHARLCIHEPFDAPEMKITRYTNIASCARYFKGRQKEVVLRSDMMTKLFSKIMKLTIAQTREFIKEERIIFPREAKKLGWIDKVIDF
mgnify:CR=1 FL=1